MRAYIKTGKSIKRSQIDLLQITLSISLIINSLHMRLLFPEIR